MSIEPDIVNVEAEEIKEQGNAAYRSGDFQTAVDMYTKAVDLDSNNAKYLVNRSLCYFSMNKWSCSYEDALKAISLSSKNQKAHFRLVKALFELSRYKEARLAILSALKECGESKEQKALEEELLTRTGIPLRPKSTDFEIIGELGDGNFSKVYKAKHKPTDRIFAIKTIEKMTVDRMKKRHPNINNEILMEKRALNRLDHPGIVRLYNTFQDYGTLYYQMDFIGGQDLFDRLHDVQLTGFLSAAGLNASGDDSQRAQVGCSWSLARFYMAEAINAVEHMHRRGIAHRDIKPENIIIGTDGHLKFVDFGTAKDFLQTDLNGPEFVGTPEYLSPSTVRNQPCGVETDLWALGAVLFQMLLGYTPYAAPSPYLTFLRIKRAFLQIPDWVPAPLASMIRLLLQSDAKARLRSACGLAEDATPPSTATPTNPSTLCYNALRSHEMFRNAYCTSRELAPTEESDATVVDELSTLEGVRTVYDRSAPQVPTLRELCLRATGRAALMLAAATAQNGGARPKSPEWMQTFDLLKLPALDRAQIRHYLHRQQRLHSPGVYRLFCASAIEARARRSDPSTGEYLGLTRSLQGHWDKDFFFLQLSAPRFGAGEAASPGSSGVTAEEDRLKEMLSAVNKLRPRFLVMVGDLTQSTPSCGTIFNTQVEAVRRTMARVSDTIPVVYCPGVRDVGTVPTPETLRTYRSRFGADYFGFWYGGMRGIVINSSLLINPTGAPEEAARQETWLTEEIEQSKLCSTSVVLFSYHPWFLEHMDEADTELAVSATQEGNFTDTTVRTFPREMRQRWLTLLRHNKVRLTISSCAGKVALDPTAAAVELRPFPRKSKGSAQLSPRCEEPPEAVDDPEMKPSEVIKAALASGELAHCDVHGDAFPPTPPTAAEEVQASDSDRESDYGNDSAATAAEELAKATEPQCEEEEEVFLNTDEDFEGPEMLFSPTAAATSPSSSTGLRAVFVQEQDMQHRYFAGAEVPKTVADLLSTFQQ